MKPKEVTLRVGVKGMKELNEKLEKLSALTEEVNALVDEINRIKLIPKATLKDGEETTC